MLLFGPKYAPAFVGIMALTTGGYIIMPFLSTFIDNKIGIPIRNLPTIYLVTGLCTVFVGSLVGNASDRFGKVRTFLSGTVITLIMVAIYTNLGPNFLLTVIVVKCTAFGRHRFAHDPGAGSLLCRTRGHRARIVQRHYGPVAAIASGIASAFAGLILVQNSAGQLQHFDWMGYIVMATALLALALIYLIHRAVPEQSAQPMPFERN